MLYAKVVTAASLVPLVFIKITLECKVTPAVSYFILRQGNYYYFTGASGLDLSHFRM